MVVVGIWSWDGTVVFMVRMCCAWNVLGVNGFCGNVFVLSRMVVRC